VVLCTLSYFFKTKRCSNWCLVSSNLPSECSDTPHMASPSARAVILLLVAVAAARATAIQHLADAETSDDDVPRLPPASSRFFLSAHCRLRSREAKFHLSPLTECGGEQCECTHFVPPPPVVKPPLNTPGRLGATLCFFATTRL
jgi:hypothetical protein